MMPARRARAASLDYLPQLLRLALPIAAQSLMVTMLNLADTVMVGQLGEVAIGSIALGNQIFFLLMLFLFGAGSGGAIFAAQYWGRRDTAGVRRSLGMSLTVAVVGASLFTIAAMTAAEPILSLFSTDAAVVTGGGSYLRIVALSYIPTAISISFAHSLRSTGNTRLPMYISAVSILFNIGANYVLIFGALGFPAMGVRGAAVATAIARAFEVMAILIAVYRPSLRARASVEAVAAPLRELLSFDRDFALRFLSRAMPVIVNEIFWSLGFTMYTVVFARMGTAYLAAYSISDTVARLMLVLFIGTGQASQILLGNRIGAGDAEGARRIGRSLIGVAAVAAAATGVIVVVGVAPLAPLAFSVDESTAAIITQFLRMFGLLLVAKVVNIHAIVGILRGGGDTRYALLIDLVPLWAIGVPAAFIVGLVLGMPAWMVYLAMNAEELVRIVLVIRRVMSGRWVVDLTSGAVPPATDPEMGLEAGDVPSTRSHP